MKTRTFLFEISPRLNGVPQTLHLAGLNSVRGADTQLNGYQWLPCISSRPTFSTSFAQNGLLSTVTQNWGQLSFYCSDSFGNTGWSAMEWNGALGRIWVGYEGDDFSGYTQIFEGSTGNLTRSGSKATLTLKGPESILDTNLLSQSYGGTGGLDGDVGMMGRIKPRAFGFCQTVTPVEINAANLVYQVHAYGPVASIPAVYEFAQGKGAPKADFPDYASLVSATLGLDEWATCLAQGLFRLGGQPSKLLTADVQPTGSQTVATIVPELLVAAGVPQARIGDMTAFSTSQWSLYQTEQASIGDVVRQAVYEAGGYLFADGTGTWQVGDYYAPQPPVTVNEDRSSLPLARSIDELDANGPVWRASVGYGKCWTVHSQDDVSPAISVLSDAQLAQDAAIQKAQEDADRANSDNVVQAARIAAQDSDGVISRGEKADRLLQLAQITTEYNGLSVQGSTFNIAEQQANYVTAYQNLMNYVASLNPPLSDSAHDTPVDPTTDQQKYHDLYQARYDLRVALTGKAAQTADYTLIRDDAGTKPQDNATKGAPSGTQVAGVDAGTLVSTTNSNTTAIAANKASIDQQAASFNQLNSVTIPAVQTQVAQANTDIATSRAKAASDLADARSTLSAATASVAADVVTVKGQADADRATAAQAVAAARSDAATIAGNLSAEVQRAQGQEGTISTTITNLSQTVGQNTSAISSETTQRVTADGVLSSRIDTVSSSTAANTAAISTTNTALTNGLAAQAARTTVIESTYGSQGGSLDANPNFAVWPDGQALPMGWSGWSALGSVTRIPNTTPRGGWVARVASDAQDGGLAQWDGTNTQVTSTVGWVVLEAEVGLVAGNYAGAGVTLHGQPSINFAYDPDGAGDVSATKTGRRVFSKLVFCSNAAFHNWHNMDNWSGFGATGAKTLDWYRSSIRPASDAEVQAGRATAGLLSANAAISSETSTRASADGALSTRIDNISASSGDAGAAIQNEAITRANNDGALSSRIDSVSAIAGNNAVAITSEAMARTTADSALASRTSALEARSSNAANLVRRGNWDDGTFGGLWQYHGSGYALRPADHSQSLPPNGHQYVALFTSQDNWEGNFVLGDPQCGLIPGTWSGRTLHVTAYASLEFSNAGAAFGVFALDGSGNILAPLRVYTSVAPHSAGYFRLEGDLTCPPGTAYIIPWIWLNDADTTVYREVRVSDLAIQDVTEATANRAAISNEQTARSTADGALSSRIDVVSSTAAGNSAAISTEQATRAGADGSLSTRIDQATSDYQGKINSANSAIGSEASTRASVDGSLSLRLDQVTSDYKAADNATNATVSTNYTTLSNATQAVANRTASLESSVNTVGASLAINDRFANWTDPAGYPTAWSLWQGNGNFRVVRQPGIASPWALQQLNDVAGVNSGLFQPTINLTYGWLVLEVTARLDANVWDGAGVTLHGQYSIDFIVDPDTNGVSGGTAQGVTRTWSKIVNNINLNGGGFNLHAMQGWDGFGHSIAPKYVTWFHLAVRPASDAEIKAQRAYATDIPNAVARIASEESTRSGADQALSNRTTTLESQVGLTTDSPAFARIRTEENTRASGDVGLGQRIDQVSSGYQNADNSLSSTINSNYTALSNATNSVAQRTSSLESYANSNTGNLNNLTSRVSSAENAITSNQQASASRTSTLEASVGVAMNVNGYLTNSSGSDIPVGWAQWARDNASRIYYDPPQAVRAGNYPTTTYRDGRSNVGFVQSIGNVPGGWYVVEADVRKLGSGDWQGAGVLVGHNSTSDNINFAASPDTHGVVYSGNNSNDRRAWSKMIFCDGQTDVQIYAMGGWEGFGLDGSSDYFTWFQCTIRKASDAEIKAQKVSDANLIARVTTSEGAITSLNGKTSAYWQTQAVAGNNRAQLTIHADANGGSGVDIVGDVRVTGQTGAGSTIVSGTGVQVYDSNGTLRVRLGLS